MNEREETMSETSVTEYKFNPAEDMLLRGDQLTNGMWVLCEYTPSRYLGSSEDDRIRAQRFRQVSGLRRGALICFTGTWVDGYQRTHETADSSMWIVKREHTVPVKAAIRKGDVIRIVPDKGSERVMVVAHVEHHVITLADLP